MDNINTYQGETKSICVSVPSGYTSGYTMTFTLNDKEYEYTGATLSITGITISDDSATINITKTQNDIPYGVYFYQCDIDNGTYKFTIAKGTYSVLPSIT